MARSCVKWPEVAGNDGKRKMAGKWWEVAGNGCFYPGGWGP